MVFRVSAAKKIKSFPKKPGVYLFKGKKGEILYIGKAKNLRSRVRSYFMGSPPIPARMTSRDNRAHIAFLLRRVCDVDFIVTDTEKEALLLENTLIKEHHPRYNLDLRDDKTYISIKIGLHHEFPGIFLTRRVKKDKAAYFGPYSSAAAAREAVELIVRHFRVRSCSDREFANRVRACLKYDIGRCTAPCVGLVSENEYAKQITEARLFLSGQNKDLIHILGSKMDDASTKFRYEDAARLRDVIAMLKGVIEKQKVVKHGGGDRDAVGIEKTTGGSAICVLQVRGGILVDKKIFHLRGQPPDETKLAEEFLLQHYKTGATIPPSIFISHKPEALAILAGILGDRKGSKVNISRPLRGETARLVALAKTNAVEVILQQKLKPDLSQTLSKVGRKLGLSQPPHIIECVDISNLSGKEAVGSLVCFVDGEPDKSFYRIYNIRTLDTPDDYAMMSEVISRRFGGEAEIVGRMKTRKPREMPDLLLVDGGKGQLAIAKKVLDDLELKIPVAAIAKGEKKGHADLVFVPARKNPLNLKRGSKELLFLMHVRDEAHRFGINAHRRKRLQKVH